MMMHLFGGWRPLGGGDGDAERLLHGGVRDGPHDACIAASFLNLRSNTTSWSTAAAMNRRRAECSRDMCEQRNKETRYLVPLK
jgi:hypothetical protein